MAKLSSRLASGTALVLLLSTGVLVGAASAQTAATEDDSIDLGTIILSAEEQIKQALGVSNITAEDLEKTPVANDISEIVRKMPGVNLTGNSASGARGNNRQIDIRGMGPENTLILIDGKPVTSRNSVKMGRQAERDTRGDSNWVPAEMIERIEIIRGPAAARYGSGAAGGVVNIITRKPEEFTATAGLHYTIPANKLEGGTKRANFMLAGPIGQDLSFRFYGNINKSEADDIALNADAAVLAGTTTQAGREGVTNKDVGALLRWEPNGSHQVDLDFSFSRQGNEYSGDSNSGSLQPDVNGVNIIGQETNKMLRRTLAVTHRGDFDFGESFSYLQWENTRNTRNGVSTGGSPDNISTTEQSTIVYDSITAKSEWILPISIFSREGKLTLGGEYRGEILDDENATGASNINSGQPLHDEQHQIGLYAEANILWGESLTLTPGLRYDYGDTYGSNWSPSLNATYAFNDEWSMKLGIARAFKAPNLFQLNPNYVYSTMGMGCPAGVTTPCEILGNPDLEPESSVNKEIGFAYAGDNGLSGSLTWFRNDYKNRIAPGLTSAGVRPAGGSYLRWENTPDAIVEGVEGNFSTPIGEAFLFNVNVTKMITSVGKLRLANGSMIENPLSLVPDHTINASLDWAVRDDLTFTLSATHYGKIEAATYAVHTGIANTDLETRSAYTLVNLGMKWDVSEKAGISAGVTNIFNEQIFRTGDGANTFNEPGRAFYIGLNATF
ncbi:FepA family TonB-dependent siderophore receptor [Pseudogemmobacter humi]|uniref:Ferric enterobactin receptor n=1 Tax=Pseudogemmobacter humi TaxID=2483812 RepID=A0A3P5XW95_9RHOB|nr:FepA family TonB-dependent siderophore receptor [Pseudogemmobacter humi]VDC33437.1 Ferric enterobactin receptor precursor [Pseudogemmobacter humi]